ncbi:hypothetical protein Enr13x_32810 [Stieleria neptunia]|uniref:Uncharacterized protein n=1 Tax=Stieleria neptunia TaxID=2527979 RepID=A0A518HRF2_9BACT|nr:winged helix-turn-helix domain-containing protein [Stieleria neptunia]QDV43425.1 hypothetical protein Enr13x_32810 [Stieleria neptunia]
MNYDVPNESELKPRQWETIARYADDLAVYLESLGNCWTMPDYRHSKPPRAVYGVDLIQCVLDRDADEARHREYVREADEAGRCPLTDNGGPSKRINGEAAERMHAFAEFARSKSKPEGDAKRKVGAPKNLQWVTQAASLYAKNPKIYCNNSEIARAVGVSPSTVNRSDQPGKAWYECKKRIDHGRNAVYDQKRANDNDHLDIDEKRQIGMINSRRN